MKKYVFIALLAAFVACKKNGTDAGVTTKATIASNCQLTGVLIDNIMVESIEYATNGKISKRIAYNLNGKISNTSTYTYKDSAIVVYDSQANASITYILGKNGYAKHSYRTDYGGDTTSVATYTYDNKGYIVSYADYAGPSFNYTVLDGNIVKENNSGSVFEYYTDKGVAPPLYNDYYTINEPMGSFGGMLGNNSTNCLKKYTIYNNSVITTTNSYTYTTDVNNNVSNVIMTSVQGATTTSYSITFKYNCK